MGKNYAPLSNRDRLLADIEKETRNGMEIFEFANRMSSGDPSHTGGGLTASTRDNMMEEVYSSKNNVNKLKSLLELYDNSGSGGAAQWSNPFDTGGSGSGGSGAPTVNTSNRFEAGLSDAELRLKNLLDNPDSINQSAAYKFRVGQGQEALQRSLGAKGLLNSGNRLMELTKYGQDMASQEYDAQYGRLGNLLGNYSQSWIGDKNANTGLFNAQANAWNTAQANQDRTKLAWAEFNKPQYASVRSSGGSSYSPIGSPMGSPMGNSGVIESSSAWDPKKWGSHSDSTGWSGGY